MRVPALPPLSIYLHIPWCIRKCPYCDFNSHTLRGALPEKEYADALIRDLAFSTPLIQERTTDSIFFGGGTPSLLSADTVHRLIEAIRRRVPLAVDVEITLEANPGATDTAHFAALRQAGVNRLSLGVQSFQPEHLHSLGRIHDSRQAQQAAEAAQRYFDNFNLDLMYALPRQTQHQALEDLRIALAFDPPHLSLYHLTLEPGTAFYHAPPPLPDTDTVADIQQAIAATLAQRGYAHYEISAYAREGHQCRHNLNYWQFGDYLGIGAGAHSKITWPGKVIRQARSRHPSAYLTEAGRSIHREKTITGLNLGFEFMMNALRLTTGFPAQWFEARTGLPLDSIKTALAAAQRQELIVYQDGYIQPTLRGSNFLNDLLLFFLPPDEKTPSQTGRG